MSVYRNPESLAEHLARRFHEVYERLAPEHGYETRGDSATVWAHVPAANKALMVAVIQELMETGYVAVPYPGHSSLLVAAEARGADAVRAQVEAFIKRRMNNPILHNNDSCIADLRDALATPDPEVASTEGQSLAAALHLAERWDMTARRLEAIACEDDTQESHNYFAALLYGRSADALLHALSPWLKPQVEEIERTRDALHNVRFALSEQAADGPCGRCGGYGCRACDASYGFHQACRDALRPLLDVARIEGASEEREGWASWLGEWLGAVGPERPTPEAILDWLRADRRPFGCYANPDAERPS